MEDGKKRVMQAKGKIRSPKASSFSGGVGRKPDFSSVLETMDLEWLFKWGAFGETGSNVSASVSSEPLDEDLIAPELQKSADLFAVGRIRKSLHWSVPWSDLMMTMFVFFAVLYVFHTSKEKACSDEPKARYVSPAIVTQAVTNNRIEKAVEPIGSMTNIYDLSRETVRSESLEKFATVALTPDKEVSIILKGDLLFDSGRAELRTEAKQSLGEIAKVLRRTPHVINLVGHTDDVPIHSERFPTNWELSAARACSVARYLIDDTGLPSSRFYVTGYGAQQPVRPNDSAENREANRRVEIIITKEKPHVEPRSLAMIQGSG